MTIDAAGLDLLFKEARSHNKWQDKPVSDETLHDLYDVLKFGPTSANSSPARFVFVRTKDGKAKNRRVEFRITDTTPAVIVPPSE